MSAKRDIKFKQRSHYLSFLAVLISVFSVFVVALIFSSNEASTSATNGTSSATSRVAVTLPEIISLRILDSTATADLDNLVLNITPTPNGAFSKGSFIAEASTSNATGYKLYLTSIGKDHNEAYTNSLINVDSSIEASVGTIPTLDFSSSMPGTDSITEAEFRVRNSNYVNRWGYSLNGLMIDSTVENGTTTIDSITENTNTSAITYTSIPEHTEERQIDNKAEATDKGLTPVTIGANVSSAVTSGTYKNTLELTAVANPLPLDYSLTFDANTEETVTNMPEENPMTESSVAAQVSFTIPDVVPKRVGYEFVGWNTESDGSGEGYTAGDNFTIEASETTSKVLYTQWKEETYTYQIRYSCISGATNCPSSETITTNQKSITYTISNKIPTLSGHTFVEYAASDYTSYDYATYQPGDTITIEYGAYLINRDTDSEYNRLQINAVNYSTFALNGLTWIGPMKSQVLSSQAPLYCPSGYRLPTASEFRSLIGSTDSEYGTNSDNISTFLTKIRTEGKLVGSSILSSTVSTVSEGVIISYYYLSLIGVKLTKVSSTGLRDSHYSVVCVK